MKIVQADFWEYASQFPLEGEGSSETLLCVTTNSVVKKNGSLVMGRGIALDFARRYPQLPVFLGAHVAANGNIPGLYISAKCELDVEPAIISFPTKNHWADPSPITLICHSLGYLSAIIEAGNYRRAIMTPPGCGKGGLNWESQVKPLMLSFNNSALKRIHVVSNGFQQGRYGQSEAQDSPA